MNYIILDLEWDSAYNTKYKRFINQILQIGAVKLDEFFNIVDTFEVTVKSSFSKKVSNRFAKLTGITTEKMLAGVPFDTAVNMFNSWIGKDTVTMTWSNSDLYSILENEDFLLNDGIKFVFERYLDLQKFVQGEMRILGHDTQNQISLADAAAIFGIETDNFELHTAKDDSLVCVELLKKCYNKERFTPLIRDTRDPDFYKRLRFKPYSISDIDDENIKPSDLEFCCDLCGKKAKKITTWKYRNRWFSANFECKHCNYKFNGRVTFKKTFDGLIVRKKNCEYKSKTEKKADEMQSVSEKL